MFYLITPPLDISGDNEDTALIEFNEENQAEIIRLCQEKTIRRKQGKDNRVHFIIPDELQEWKDMLKQESVEEIDEIPESFWSV